MQWFGMIWEIEIHVQSYEPEEWRSFHRKAHWSRTEQKDSHDTSYGLWCVDFAAAFVARGHGNVW